LRQNVSINKELRDKFLLYCNSKGQKMSTVLQKAIELMIEGRFNPFEEKKDGEK